MAVLPPSWLPALIIVLFAGIGAGVTGFGFALVAVPLLIIILPPKLVVPIILMLGAFSKFIVIYECRRWIDLRRIWPLMIGGIVGLPLGTYLLVMVNVQTLKIGIGVVITAFAIAFILGWRVKVRNEKLALVPVGIASGILNGGTAMGGPPIVLFLSNQGAEKQFFRGNLSVYFVILNLATIPAHLAGGLITTDVLRYALFLLPVLLVGTVAGVSLARHIPERTFRGLTLVVVVFASLLSIASGVGLI